MTIPYERTRAILQTKTFLLALQDPTKTEVPENIREWARALARHYPDSWHVEAAHKERPDLFGPVPPFSRLRGSDSAHVAIDAMHEAGDELAQKGAVGVVVHTYGKGDAYEVELMDSSGRTIGLATVARKGES